MNWIKRSPCLDDVPDKGCFWGDGGSTQSGTSIVKSDSAPWAKAQPYIEYGLQQAGINYGSQNPQYYPNSTVVPTPSNQTEAALTGIENRATNGSPINTAASQGLLETLQGNYLDPATNPAFQKAAGDITSKVQGMATAAGRYGSGAMANVGREALTDLAAKTFDTERGRMMQAESLAPTIANQDYFDLSQLGQAGAAREQKAGAELQDDIARWNFNQNLPQQKLAQYMAMIQGGNVGSSTTQTTPIYTNPWATGLGAAGTAASIYSMFK